jgi:hypothetical protein
MVEVFPARARQGAVQMRRYAILLIVVAISLAACSHRSSRGGASPSSVPAPGQTDADSENAKTVDGVARYGVPYQMKGGRAGGSSSDDRGTFTLTAFAPLSVIPDPALDGTMYYRLAMKVMVRPETGKPHLDLKAFSIGPSSAPQNEDDRMAHTDQAQRTPATAQSTAVITAACRGVAPLDQMAEAAGSSSAEGSAWVLDPARVKPFTGCLTFQYQGTPTSFAYSEGEAEAGVVSGTWWPLSLPKPGGKARAKTLASFSGTGTRLLPAGGAARTPKVKVCWSMTGEGNNVIDTRSDKAGANRQILVRAVGPTGNCQDGLTLDNYLYVVGAGDWSITVTSF